LGTGVTQSNDVEFVTNILFFYNNALKLIKGIYTIVYKYVLQMN